MKIKIRKRGFFGLKKIVLQGNVEKIKKGYDPFSPQNPHKDGIAILFKGVEGVGMISLTGKEIKMVIEEIGNLPDEREEKIQEKKKTFGEKKRRHKRPVRKKRKHLTRSLELPKKR